MEKLLFLCEQEDVKEIIAVIQRQNADFLMLKVMTLGECCGKRFLGVLMDPQLGMVMVLHLGKLSEKDWFNFLLLGRGIPANPYAVFWSDAQSPF